MADSDRALVAALRAELASIEPGRPCDRAAEVEGLGTGAIRGDRPALGRLMVRLLRDGTAPLRPFAWESAPDHCRAAWLRGRFLARGSLSVAQGRLHLEFVVPPEDSAELGARLASVGLPAGVRLRRGRGVVTWKGADEIGTFLRWIGAGSSLLELESRQVGRAVRGDLNRLLNAESANLERIAVTAARQLDAIATLDADGRLAALPERVRDVAAARRSIPEASLGELATELAIPRGRIQRALERIEAAALHGDDGAAGPSPRGPGAARAERPGHDRPPASSRRGRAVA
ncbi:MAG TPA: DNA-binding protein WhiA [Patescibacteria group bacterium]|nr:DNA-binding protein WhiA [Patescibacteria group bacterium]